jgi:4-hydroxy-tetrahydrodipicolinate synthase
MSWTTNVLVVANITAASEELRTALVQRANDASAQFTLIVPADPVAGGREVARARLDEALAELRGAGLEIDGRVGSGDPILVVSDEWDPRRYDEIVVSTLPQKVSKWLHAGLPERIERITGARVTQVVSQPPKPEVEAGPAPVHEKYGVMTPLSVLTWGTAASAVRVGGGNAIIGSMPPNLGAILTAMVTPFDDRGRIDEDAAVRLMNHLVEHGSDGLVVCGTTGESSTLTDDEQLALIALAVKEMAGRATVVGGVGSNDTRHAVHLTERATELRPDALLSVNPYYNRPNRRGIIAHYKAVAAATDLPILLYNIPQRTASDLPNDLLAELAQIDQICGVKQANAANLAKIDGMAIYAGNDDLLADVLDLGEPGGVLTASHVFGDEMHRMVDEPDKRREIEAGLADVYRDLAIAPLACSLKAALGMIGIPVGVPRLPYLELDASEREIVHAMLERHGMLSVAAG